MGDLNPFLEVIINAVSSYIAVIFFLRISGKRTLAKWNSFDFIVTVALGSILASSLLSTKDTFGKAILGFSLLVLFQYIISWVSVRSSVIQKFIKAEPALLLYKGKMQNDVMKRERIAEGELLAALRGNGVSCIDNVDAVVLETDGSFSIICSIDEDSTSTLKDVKEFNRIKNKY